MSRSVICAHCGTVVEFEPRTARTGIRLTMHLRGHRTLCAADDLLRWAQIFEHFFFVPLVRMSSLDVRRDIKLLACTPSLDQ